VTSPCDSVDRCQCEPCRVARVAVAIQLTNATSIGTAHEVHQDFLEILGSLKEARAANSELADIAEGALHPGNGKIRPRIAELRKAGSQ
jgi:hypothetical protein